MGSIKSFKPELTEEEIVEQARLSSIELINSAYEYEMSEIFNKYSELVQKTWPRQESEARGYIVDPEYPTPLIDALSRERGIDKSELVSRIIYKSDAWASASGIATGRLQRLEDRILSASTVEEIENIKLSIIKKGE